MQDVWTTGRLLTWIRKALADAGVEGHQSCADMLAMHALGCDRLRLYTDWERPWSDTERDRLRGLVGRALKHEPVQHIVGEAWFYSLRFKSDRRALVPRPSSETLVDTALEHCKACTSSAPRIADVCTGSGCIAIAILRNLPDARAWGVDISAEALALATENANALNVANRLTLLEGDLLAPLAGAGPFNCIVANPPYIPDDEWDDVAPNVRNYEPIIALRGGPDGLDLVRPLLVGAPDLMAPGGVLAIEVAASRTEAVANLARTTRGLGDIRILKDSDGLPRTIVARRV